MKQYVRGETPVEEAISLIVQSLPYPKGTETVSLLQGLGRVLAVPVKARIPQPPFTRSPLDGYALRASGKASREPVPAGGKRPGAAPASRYGRPDHDRRPGAGRSGLCRPPGGYGPGR